MFKEFKEFALAGNLIDMAIAFVMGGLLAKSYRHSSTE